MLCFLFVLRVQSSNMKIYALETFAFIKCTRYFYISESHNALKTIYQLTKINYEKNPSVLSSIAADGLWM